jgi:hypothetical protein
MYVALRAIKRTGPERALREAIVAGRPVDLRTDQPRADGLARGAVWGRRRTVRAEVLAELLTQQGEGARRPRALLLAGARITGALDLTGLELVCSVLLLDCWFDEPVILTEAQAVAVRLPGCHLPALQAARLTTQGNLELNLGFTVKGDVRLLGAHVGGQLDLSGATLTSPNGVAFYGDTLTVDQNMFCRAGFTAQGEVRLLGAHVGGQLNLNGATLTNPKGQALNADALTVGQVMSCLEPFTAEGEVRLRAARIGAQLSFEGATLTNPDGVALDLQSMQTPALLLRTKTAPSRIDLGHARVEALADDEATWPEKLHLRGFAYDGLPPGGRTPPMSGGCPHVRPAAKNQTPVHPRVQT